MSTLRVIPNLKDIKACVICSKPLGQESQDLGFLTCHDHRNCSTCGTEMPVREIKWCVKKAYEDELEDFTKLELIHTRCAVLQINQQTDPTLSIKQSYYDYLNLVRLCIEPDMDLAVSTNEQTAMIQSAKLMHGWDHDKLFLFLRKLEACAEQVNIAIAQDKKTLKARADEREKVNARKAKQEASTSSRPVQKPADDEGEILLAEFMRINGITDRKAGLKLKRERDKAIQSWMACGMDETAAQNLVDENLRKQGRIK